MADETNPPLGDPPVAEQELVPVPPPGAPWPTAGRPCPVCGRDWGPGPTCQFCGQVEGLPSGVHLSSPARRFGGHLLDVTIAVVTLLVGWLVWTLIVWSRGQTPGKQLLGMRCVSLREGRTASWGTMFVRDFLCKGVLFGFLTTITFGIGAILYFWLTWDSKNQELWDKMVGTIVVDDPNRLLA